MRVKLKTVFATCLTTFVFTILLTINKQNATQSCEESRDLNLQSKELANREKHIQINAPLTNCELLFEGDVSEQEKAKEVMKTTKLRVLSDDDIFNRAKNCSNFKRIGHYLQTSKSKLERNFPIAFSILMHENVQQMEFLLRHIYRPQNVYCIHIDSKAEQSVHNAVKQISKCFHNVFIASKLENIIYAGYARLQAELNCMSDALQRKEPWKYYINLVGSVFPLKTNLEMVKILKIYNGANDIEGIKLNDYLKRRLEYSYQNVYPTNGNPYIVKTDKKKSAPPHGINIIKGSAYGIFSREFVNFVLTDKKARDLLEWSRDTMTPDEHYWATLHHIGENPQLKSPGGYKEDPVNKPWLATYAAWPPRDKCYGKVVHGVCVFGIGDLPTLNTRKEFFANKFSVSSDPTALQCMAEWLKQRVYATQPIDGQYYRELPFILR